MKCTSRQLASRLYLAGFLVSLALVAGCEDGGDSEPAHDFGDNDPDLYVAVGDSQTDDTYPSILAGMLGKTVIDEGHGGDHTLDTLPIALSALENYKPGYLLIWVGANDATHGPAVEEVMADLRTIIEAAKANKTVPLVATLTSMLYSHAAYDGSVDMYNAKIRTVASEEGITLVDLHAVIGDNPNYFQEDGLHLTDEGYQLVAQAFFNALQ